MRDPKKKRKEGKEATGKKRREMQKRKNGAQTELGAKNESEQILLGKFLLEGMRETDRILSSCKKGSGGRF